MGMSSVEPDGGKNLAVAQSESASIAPTEGTGTEQSGREKIPLPTCGRVLIIAVPGVRVMQRDTEVMGAGFVTCSQVGCGAQG